MYMFFALNLSLAFFVYFFIPETKGKSLETMDVLFGGANHAEDATPCCQNVLGPETPGHTVEAGAGEKTAAAAAVVPENKANVEVKDSTV